MTVYRDSHGTYLVASAGDDDLMRAAWTIIPEPDGTLDVRGPRAFGSYLKFCPSDWTELPAPYPDDIQRILGRLRASPIVYHEGRYIARNDDAHI